MLLCFGVVFPGAGRRSGLPARQTRQPDEAYSPIEARLKAPAFHPGPPTTPSSLSRAPLLTRVKIRFLRRNL